MSYLELYNEYVRLSREPLTADVVARMRAISKELTLIERTISRFSSPVGTVYAVDLNDNNSVFQMISE